MKTLGCIHTQKHECFNNYYKIIPYIFCKRSLWKVLLVLYFNFNKNTSLFTLNTLSSTDYVTFDIVCKVDYMN